MCDNPTVEIVEQPATKTVRFRYSCEGRTAGSLPGSSSSINNKTYPAIRVLGYTGSAVVIASCVTKDKPYRPHPHNLVGKECGKGVCKVEFQTDSSAPKIVSFRNLGIQCAKRNEVEQILSEREALRIDPFKTGFKHKAKPKYLELNVIRICFHVIIRPDPNDASKLISLKPIVSNLIHDKKSKADLLIYDISDTTSPTNGGKKIMIFCEKLQKEDIKVRFFENSENNSWEDWGEFQSKNVHRQTAIAFKTPRYVSQNIVNPVNVFIQLVRPSDKAQSEALPFQYVPDFDVNVSTKRKKLKIDEGKEVYGYLQTHEKDQRQKMDVNVNYAPNSVHGQNIPFASNFNLPSNNHVLPQSNAYLQQHSIHEAQHHIYEMPPKPGYGASNLCTNYNPHQYDSNSRQQFYDPMANINNIIPTSEQMANWNNSRPTQMDRMNNIAQPSHVYQQFKPMNIFGENQIQQFYSNDMALVNHHLNIMASGPVATGALFDEIENMSDSFNSNLVLQA